MNQQIVHRGPDDAGLYVDGAVALGMRRLSIIDLSGGHQPICNEDATLWIVFNGEIYNYRELRLELETKGHAFRTHSDTETILHSYEEWGDQCVNRLNGMFAFAIWNRETHSLFVARDRLGIKPLYYSWDGDRLIFGSEIKSVLEQDRTRAEINPNAIWDYLTFRYVPGPATMWRNIFKLGPGHTLTFDGTTGVLQIQRFWDIDYSNTRADPGDDLGAFTELFTDAVRCRLIADVPVGILLSGGLDSSAVAAAVSEVHNSRLSTFSVAFTEGGEYSELPFAREVSAHFGTDHHEITIDFDQFLSFLPELVWYTDEPLADPASIPLYYVSRLASQHVKVVLSGEGADEVLGGYTFDKSVARWRRLSQFQRIPKWLRQSIGESVLSITGRTVLAERLRNANVPLAMQNQVHIPYMTSYFSESEKRGLWPDAMQFPDSGRLVRGYYERARTGDPLHQALYAYCQDWLVEDLLMKADKMTMANSLELRVPFLDYRLVEWLASRPSTVKVGRGSGSKLETKHLLRRYLRNRVPSTVLNRPKRGFPVPLLRWMRGPLGEYARTHLLAPDTRVRQWFGHDALKVLCDRGTSGGDPAASQKVWLLLVLELWCRRWL